MSTNHVELYGQLRGFVSLCYGEPVSEDAVHEADENGTYAVRFGAPQEVDRVVLMEDQSGGQVIRSYEVHGKVASGGEGWNVTALDVYSYTLLSGGTSVGYRKIDLFEEAVKVSKLRVNTTFADTPRWRSVSVHLCDEPTANGTTAPIGTSS
ncbi:hypothetical protein IMZ48_06930 [Candidatus Bathyarchaeota archaeon]|nr:hypothetical protein [Candidatus Bathyarchaeota archaeon]